MNTNSKGFSLVELMIVVAIIGLLAAIGVPQYSKFQARARQSEAKAALGALYSAEQAFFQEWNQYSVNLRNIGFGVTGVNLRYVTGFGLGLCAGYSIAAGAPTETPTAGTVTQISLSNGGNNAATIALLYPTGAPTFHVGGVSIQGKTAVAGGVCTAATVFTGVSEGDPKNTSVNVAADRWTINQAKQLSNPLVGL